MIDIGAPTFSDAQANPHRPRGTVFVGQVEANAPLVGGRRVLDSSRDAADEPQARRAV